MNPLSLLQNTSALRALNIHLIVSCVIGGVVYFAATQGDSTHSLSLSAYTAAGLLLTVILGCSLLGKELAVLCRWETRLARLSQPDRQRLGSLTLQSSSGNTPADFGWNRLVELGRSWQTLDQLQNNLEKHLTQSPEQECSEILNVLAEGVVLMDTAGNVLYANTVMLGVSGCDTLDDLIGHKLVDVLSLDETTAVQFLDTSTQHATVEWSFNNGNSDKTLRASRRLLGPDRYVWTIRDVTQQRLAEAMRERFLAAATHEFRTPLANIRAYAESLELGHDVDTESRKRFYNIIQSESLRLSQLVDDLLDISRMQAGALALESHETDLSRMIEEIAGKVHGQMDEKNLQFRMELPPKLPKASVDKSKLSAALVNLLGNAVKYTPDGGKITFRVDLVNERIQFSITDTGIGIVAEELPRIFDRFFRSNDDRVRGISGSGLGLSLAQEIARLHSGDLVVESELNKGSTFRMTIPLPSMFN